MNKLEELRLKLYANQIRQGIVTSTHAAKSGHPGGSLSIADLMAYLYEKELRVDPANPKWEDRDRFVLSKGHTAPALYAALAHKGFFPVEDLLTLRHPSSHLQGHPNMNSTPGVDMSTGSLGQGISAACGMAKAMKFMGKNDVRVYTVLGDGESQEGQVWEAARFAAHYKLDNLCVFVDYNGLQIDGKVEDVMELKNLEACFRDVGFATMEISAHNFEEIASAMEFFHNNNDGRPTFILMKSVKGKGVSFMENNAGWHGKATKDDELAVAMAELKAEQANIEAEISKEEAAHE